MFVHNTKLHCTRNRAAVGVRTDPSEGGVVWSEGGGGGGGGGRGRANAKLTSLARCYNLAIIIVSDPI